MGSDPKSPARGGTGVTFGTRCHLILPLCPIHPGIRVPGVPRRPGSDPGLPEPGPQNRFFTPHRPRQPGNGARPGPGSPAVVGPRAERAAATSHGRGWAASVAPCKPPTVSAGPCRRPASPAHAVPGCAWCRNAGKPPDRWSGGLPGMVVRRRPTLPQGPPCSTIGAVRLSFRVRDVTGRFPHAMTTETL